MTPYIKSSFGRAMPMASSCPTAGFTKHSYHMKELMCLLDVDHVTVNNRRKHAYHC